LTVSNDAFREQAPAAPFLLFGRAVKRSYFKKRVALNFSAKLVDCPKSSRQSGFAHSKPKKQSDVLLLYDKAEVAWFAPNGKKFAAQ
jgi:hypothetical protein